MSDSSSRTEQTWRALAEGYEVARARPDSLDALVEFPAQLSLLGDIRGKRILDLACGSGAKALHLAAQGAREVVGVDISETFIDALKRRELPGNVHFVQGDLARLAEIEAVSGEFDVVLVLNALGFVEDAFFGRADRDS